MSTWRRLVIAAQIWIAIGAVAILYYQVFKLHTQPMAEGEHSGPFTPVVGQVDTIVPVVLMAIGVGVLVWVLVGAVQDERSRNRRPVR